MIPHLKARARHKEQVQIIQAPQVVTVFCWVLFLLLLSQSYQSNQQTPEGCSCLGMEPTEANRSSQKTRLMKILRTFNLLDQVPLLQGLNN